MATANDTKLTSLAMAEFGNGLLNPFDGQPIPALGARAETNGFADDFLPYKGPVAAGSADGYTLAVTTTGVLSIDTANTNGAGVLDFALPAIADAVSLETESNLVEVGLKCIKAVVHVNPENMTDSDIHFGLGTVGVTHGTADSADMVEVQWDAATASINLRTQRNGGGVTTTAGSVALNARVAAQAGVMLLAIFVKGNGDVAALVSLNDGQVWDIVATLAAGDASLPIAADPMGMYVAGVGVVVLTGIDVDYWMMMIER